MTSTTSSTGKFIVFEGGEGAGKTTQLAWLLAALKQHEVPVVATHEPGGTRLGSTLRETLLALAGTGEVCPRAEVLLFAADRAQHVAEKIEPALISGLTVVSDRYADSTVAYQCGGRGESVSIARAINDYATGALTPDLVLLLDLPPLTGLARAHRRGPADRMESAELGFHHRVRATFLFIAGQHPDRYRVINADQPPGQVHQQVWTHVAALLGLPADQPLTTIPEQDPDPPRQTCGQCGQLYAERACGPSHAIIAAERASAVSRA